MASILPFTPRSDGAVRRPDVRPDGLSAAILLFTGVRYERLHTDEPAATSSGEGRGNRRPRRRSGQK